MNNIREDTHKKSDFLVVAPRIVYTLHASHVFVSRKKILLVHSENNLCITNLSFG